MYRLIRTFLNFAYGIKIYLLHCAYVWYYIVSFLDPCHAEPDIPYLIANSVDPDQLASEEAN